MDAGTSLLALRFQQLRRADAGGRTMPAQACAARELLTLLNICVAIKARLIALAAAITGLRERQSVCFPSE